MAILNITEKVQCLRREILQKYTKGLQYYSQNWREAEQKSLEVHKKLVDSIRSEADFVIANGEQRKHRSLKGHDNVIFLGQQYSAHEDFLLACIERITTLDYEAFYYHRSTQSQKLLYFYKSSSRALEVIRDATSVCEITNI